MRVRGEFADRADAGRRLAAAVVALGLADPVVLALPRGGVPVAYEVAAALGAPWDVFVARKVGAPGHAEYGVGAVAEGGALVANETARLAPETLAALAEVERAELDRRVRRYRGDRPLPTLTGRDVVLVDDGLATGVTAEAALRALRFHRPRGLVLAVPVAARDGAARLATVADDVVAVLTPRSFLAVGQFYGTFAQTTDDEVLALLARRPY